MRFSVLVQAEGDRVVDREEIVELADAVAAHGGIASGIGTTRYAARVLVDADRVEEAVDRARAVFVAAAARAGLPAWPVTASDAVSEDEAREEEEADWVPLA